MGNMVGCVRGEERREIWKKFIEQRVMRTERVVAEKFVKAAHGLGAVANLEMWFATDVVAKNTGWNLSYVDTKFWNKSNEEVGRILVKINKN